MGHSSCKPLHQDDIVRNLMCHTMAEVIEYFNWEDTFDVVQSVLQSNWSCEQGINSISKIEVLCASGPPGQGKTELCNQLCMKNSTFALKGLTAMVTIPLLSVKRAIFLVMS